MINFGISILIAYFLGSISFAVLIGKLFYKTDVREHGSGNAGTTNTMRILGWKPGLAVLFCDALKGYLAIFIGGLIMGEDCAMEYYKVVLAAVAVLGHIFPIYTKFKGGKGVATMLGVILALYPEALLCSLLIFAVVLLLSKYVSLASITAAILFPIIDIFLFKQEDVYLQAFSVLVAIVIPFLHKKNIKRLLKGEESKFSLKKK